VTLENQCPTFPPIPCRGDVRILAGPELREIASTKLQTDGRAAAIGFSPDGTSLALGSADGLLRVIDADTASTIDTAGERNINLSVTSVTYLTERLLVASHADGSLTLWQLDDESLSEVWRRDDLDASAVLRLDDDTLALGTRSGSTSIRSVDAIEQPLKTLPGHNEPIRTLHFDETSRRLVSSDRATVKLWDLDTGTTLFTIENAIAGRLSVGGKLLYTSTASDTDPPPAIWQIELDAIRRQGCEVAGRNLTEQEWATHLPTREPYHTTCP
jgi:WD40 repeat protein